MPLYLMICFGHSEKGPKPPALEKHSISYIAEVHNNSSSSIIEIPDVDGSTYEYELWIMYYTVLWITHI